MRWTALVMGGLLWGCTHARAGRAPDAAVDAPVEARGDAAADAAADARADAHVDAGPSIDAMCTPGCHWDCFGGSECQDGIAYVNAFAPRECCYNTDPWPGPGPLCAGFPGYSCAGGTCAAPDPRYRQCLFAIGTRAERCDESPVCEHLLLWCPEGAAKQAGAPCAGDRDCRPAADGISRLRCDTAKTGTCIVEARPSTPADYGATCGLTLDDVPWVYGEAVVSSSQATCPLCQVMRGADGCLRQGCTMACTYDEDCPSGSICLCAAPGSDASSYCAAATDRNSDEGRAAGLPACP